MEIVIRVDSSSDIGSGHVMRCLTLAELLRQKGGKVSFVCRELPGDLCGFIDSMGFRVFRLEYYSRKYQGNDLTDEKKWLSDPKLDALETCSLLAKEFSHVEWLIIDHYGIDSEWEDQLRPYVDKILIIDDLANRSHNCDVLLDQNLVRQMQGRYNTLVPDKCIKLLGPRFLLLRKEFIKERKVLKRRNGRADRILIFISGGDSTNETAKSMAAVKNLGRPEIKTDVIIGASNPHIDEIVNFCGQNAGFTVHCQTDKMASLIAHAHIGIGAGGGTLWERCYLGLPTLTGILAENQYESVLAAEENGVLWNLGWFQDMTGERMTDALNKVIDDCGALINMECKALELMAEDENYGHPVVNLIMVGD